MHPHIQTWGSMLRLYGSKMAESYLKVIYLLNLLKLTLNSNLF